MNPNPERLLKDIVREPPRTIAATPAAGAPKKRRAPTLYVIIAIKFLKGLLFVALAVVAYTLSDNDLPAEYRHLLHLLRLNPERKFFAELAARVGTITEANVLWVAAGTLLYSLFSIVEGTGLLFRASWACWLAIGESAFFIPIEVYELVHNPSWMVSAILFLNIVIVWYLLSNRQRLFQHHQPQGGPS